MEAEQPTELEALRAELARATTTREKALHAYALLQQELADTKADLAAAKAIIDVIADACSVACKRWNRKR